RRIVLSEILSCGLLYLLCAPIYRHSVVRGDAGNAGGLCRRSGSPAKMTLTGGEDRRRYLRFIGTASSNKRQ
ncbi:MAG: hypothetical protein ABSG41_18750, partial [Bryobacteraceae bacterium]